MRTYIAVYLAGVLLTVCATPLVARIAHAFGILDEPSVRKIHNRRVPRLGGAGVFLSTMLISTAALVSIPGSAGTLGSLGPQFVAMLAGGTLIFALGLYDDVHGLPAHMKLLGQLGAATIVCVCGLRIDSVAIGQSTLQFGALAGPLTILWIVGVINAVNMIDGLDGLATGIAAIAATAIAFVAIRTGQPAESIVLLALLGSLTGFLPFNFYPAKTFMGDCGSMFVGFVLAIMSLRCGANSPAVPGLAIAVVALGFPIFDLAFSIMRRLLYRRSIFAPDRSHIHHRLLDRGLHQRHVVILLYAMSTTVTLLGMIMMITSAAETTVVFASVLMLVLMVFLNIYAQPLRNGLAAISRNLQIARQARLDARAFEEARLRFDQARCFDSWWAAIRATAAAMRFHRIAISSQYGAGEAQQVHWQHADAGTPAIDVLRTALRVRPRPDQPPLDVVLEVAHDGSLESAGRRMKLFGRLMDEYPVFAPPNARAAHSERPTAQPRLRTARLPGPAAAHSGAWVGARDEQTGK